MKVIHHKVRPLLEFPDEPWRQSLRLAVNRSAGSNSLSVWLAEMGDHHRTPLRWHDTEEVLVFLEVDGDGFARVGDEEHKIETQTSVVVPPGTIHAFGLLDGRVLKSVSILRDADAKKLKANHESFWLRTVSTKLPTLFSWHDRCGVVHQNFPRNSIHWVGLPEILIMASLLRIVPGELRWEGFSETYFREGGIFMSKFRIEPHGRLQEWVAGEKG